MSQFNGQLGLQIFPAALDVAEFRQAWEEWLADRRERRLPRYTERAQRMQLRRLEELGPDAAIEAINWSIAQGYKGIFPPPAPQKGHAQSTNQTAPRPPSVWELKQKLDVTEERIRQLQSRSPGSHCNLADFLSKAELAELSTLITTRKSLKQQITQP